MSKKDEAKVLKGFIDGFSEYLETKRTLTREEALVDYMIWLKVQIEKCENPEFKITLSSISSFISNTQHSYYQHYKNLENGKNN